MVSFVPFNGCLMSFSTCKYTLHLLASEKTRLTAVNLVDVCAACLRFPSIFSTYYITPFFFAPLFSMFLILYTFCVHEFLFRLALFCVDCAVQSAVRGGQTQERWNYAERAV
jgi:hypothetical protein